MEKEYRKYALKTSAIPLFNFGEERKTTNTCKKLIQINIITSSLKMLIFFWNKIPIPVLAKLLMTWCTYTKSKMPYLNIGVVVAF